MYIDLLYLKVEAFSIGVSLKRSKQLLSDRSYRTLLNRAARLSRSETLLQMFTLSRTSLTFGNTSLRIGYSNPPVYRKVGHLESMAKQPSNYHPGNTQNSMFSGVVLQDSMVNYHFPHLRQTQSWWYDSYWMLLMDDGDLPETEFRDLMGIW